MRSPLATRAVLRASISFCFMLAGASAVRADEPAADAAPAEVSFRRDVAPVLVERCLVCHGQQDAKGEYQLHNFESLMKGGYSGSPVITLGKSDESELYLLVSSDDADVAECDWYIMGVHDAIVLHQDLQWVDATICVPDQTTAETLRGVVVDYLSGEDNLAFTAVSMVYNSLEDSYACEGLSKK